MSEYSIPADLQELHASTAEWDGSLMVKFARAHGIEIPWKISADVDIRKYLIERIAALEAENAQLNAHCERFSAALMDWENREAAVCPEDVGFEEVFVALEAQVQQLREALKSAAPVINCLDVYGRYLPVKYLIADTLAASEPK